MGFAHKNKWTQRIPGHENKSGITLKGLLWYSTAKCVPGVIFTLDICPKS